MKKKKLKVPSISAPEMKYVKVDAKTTLYVDASISTEEVIQRYKMRSQLTPVSGHLTRRPLTRKEAIPKEELEEPSIKDIEEAIEEIEIKTEEEN
jgi:hypothetical protein